jgi:hypothetical protein
MKQLFCLGFLSFLFNFSAFAMETLEDESTEVNTKHQALVQVIDVNFGLPEWAMKAWDSGRAFYTKWWSAANYWPSNEAHRDTYDILGKDCQDVDKVKAELKKVLSQYHVVDIVAMLHAKTHLRHGFEGDVVYEALRALAQDLKTDKVNSEEWLKEYGVVRLVHREACGGGDQREYVDLGVLFGLGHTDAEGVAPSASPFITFKLTGYLTTGHSFEQAIKLAEKDFEDEMRNSMVSLKIYNAMIRGSRTAEEVTAGTKYKYSYRSGIDKSTFTINTPIKKALLKNEWTTITSDSETLSQ